MIFIYSVWDKFCSDLKEKGLMSIPAKEVSGTLTSYIVLKHDIENTVSKAYKLAEIEHRYGHKGSYYIHAHLLKDSGNVKLLKKMQEMGHEISYHHDVMDSNNGNIQNAIEEFSRNIGIFKAMGFSIKTVCQHGNPIIERIGYTSNRDFFRNKTVQQLYRHIADIMVDYKDKYDTDYIYYSDAGRQFKLIYDPINNDIINSDDKNILYDSLTELLNNVAPRAIISTHPHRWTKSRLAYMISDKVFVVIKKTAKIMIKVPVFKKLMSKYYYLAKKI